jgi:hypothetical protein
MFLFTFTKKQSDFPIAFIIAGLMGAVAAATALTMILLLLSGLDLHTVRSLEPNAPMALLRSLSDNKGWLVLVMVYSALVIGLPAFAILYLGGADADN